MRLKEICDYISRGTTPDYVDASPYKVMNQATFSKGWLDESSIRYTSKCVKDAQIKKGDLLMASTGGGVLGKVFFYDSDDDSFYADSHVSILRNSKKKNLMKYLYYYFSIKYEEINATLVKGSTNQTELQRNYLLAYELDIPSLSEQQRIVDYLDAKLATIERRIAVLKKQQDAYIRLKKSVIHQAVTHGLNPDVRLKDSGIEWIGMVPEHWKVKRLKEVGFIGSGTTPNTKKDSYYHNGIHPWLNTGCVQDCAIVNPADYVTDLALKECNGLTYYPIGTILVAMYGGGTIGNVGIMQLAATINQACCAICSNRQIVYPKYLFYSLYSKKNKLISLGFGGTQINLSQGLISNFIIEYPPLSEQRAIADYLDKKYKKIDAAIENICKQIDASKKLKRALINEVITSQRAI